MARDTVVPRPGVEINLTLTIMFKEGKVFTQRELGNIESDINQEFRAPSQMGIPEKVFTVDVIQGGQLARDSITIKTSASELEKGEVERMVSIFKQRTSVTPTDWEVKGRMSRKKSVMEFM